MVSPTGARRSLPAAWSGKARPRAQTMGRATSFDGQLDDLELPALELRLEDARDVRRELDPDRPPGVDVLVQVVAVDVHLIGDVGMDDDRDLLALPRGGALDAADGLAALDLDVDRHRPGSLSRGRAALAAAATGEGECARNDEK